MGMSSTVKGSYEKQNLTLIVISYENETCRRLVSLISYEMTTHVRSSIAVLFGNFVGLQVERNNKDNFRTIFYISPQKLML